MTYSAQLQTRSGVMRRLYLRIEGLPYLFWQPSSVALPEYDATRTNLQCLRAPAEEHSLELDLAKCEQQASAMTIELDDIADPAAPTTFLFAKLFAPARWDSTSNKRAALSESTSDAWSYVEATDASIALKDSTSFPASGTAYIGRETFTYTGNAANTLTGCSRGLFPAFDTTPGTWAYQFAKPPKSTDKGAYGLQCSTVPYTMLGRQVGLYVATYDDAAGTWSTYTSNLLLFAGTISQGYSYNPLRCCWALTCENMIGFMKKKICSTMASVDLAHCNINGVAATDGREFVVNYSWYLGNTQKKHYVRGVVKAGTYEAIKGYGGNSALITEINSALYNDNALGYNTGDALITAGSDSIWLSLQPGSDGKCQWLLAGYGDTDDITHVYITIYPVSSTGVACHALLAAGATQEDGRTTIVIEQNEALTPTGRYYACEQNYATAYHPLDRTCNGGVIYCTPYEGADFQSDQGDYSSTRGALVVEDAHLNPWWEVDGSYYAYYSAKPDGSISGNYFVLAAEPIPVLHADGYVCQRYGDDPVSIKQAYIPNWKSSTGTTRGPFELLLDSLLSTGTATYNDATYDVLPAEYSVGLPSILVDTTTFVQADYDIAGDMLSERRCLCVSEATSWWDLLLQECQLFGYALVWDYGSSTNAVGRFVLKRVHGTQIDAGCVELSTANNANTDEMPEYKCNVDTVINSFEFKLKASYTGKTLPSVIITDIDSVDALGVVKTAEISHDSIYIVDKGKLASYALSGIVSRDRTWMRFPWPSIEVTLSHVLLISVSVGDIVKVTLPTLPDPTGTGTYTATSIYGRVVRVSWKPAKWTGTATVLLFTNTTTASMVPWAPSALVDSTAANGGWDSVKLLLKLVSAEWGTGAAGEYEDGAAFSDGDKLRIIERAPADPTAPLEWTVTVDGAYEASEANCLHFAAGTALAGWDADKQYTVTFDDYGSVVTAQKTRGAFLCDAATHLIGSDQCNRWGS